MSDNPESDASVQDRTEALLRGLTLVLRHHDAGRDITDQLRLQLSSYLNRFPSEDIWLKHVKHALAYPLARYLRNEPPKSTGDDFSPKGSLKKWMDNRLTCFNRKNTHLWYSWFQAKRSCLPSSDKFISSTYDEHLSVLTREDDGDDETIDQIFSDESFLSALNAVRKEVKKTIFDYEHQPSTNASFEVPRSRGGQQGALLDDINLTGCSVPRRPLIYSMDWAPHGYHNGRRISNVQLVTYESHGRDEWRRLSTYAQNLKAETLSCTIQAVIEPLKVRVISKGEALPYYLMKPLQKTLWNGLQTMNAFRLVGRPFSPTDMIDLRKKTDQFDEWFSVDYSAATDGLSWKYSGKILKYVIQDLPQAKQEQALSVLGPHKLFYPQGRSRPSFKGVMKRGQLMGSILSFPILCLANLGVYLRTSRSFQSDWSIQERLDHVLVNGDDMLYAAPRCFWHKHIEIGSKVGLNMSVGKSYVHPTYANVNSTSVHYDLRVPTSTPWEIPFLNTGLFVGNHKVSSLELAESHHKDSGSVTIIPQLLRGCLPNKESGVLQEYLTLHGKDIAADTLCYSSKGPFYRNLFLPESVGGMGVPRPRGFKTYYTDSQRKLAALLYESAGLVSSQRPLPGFDMPLHQEMAVRPWTLTILPDRIIPRYDLRGVFLTNRSWKLHKLGFLLYSESAFSVLF